MIVKRHLNFLKTLPYVRVELALGAVISVLVYLIYDVANVKEFAIPNVLPTLLGSALAIFLAFRNNAAYSRWGEGAQAWSSIANNSRIFARLVLTFVQAHNHTPTYDAHQARAYQREMIYRHVAWVHALRLHLRNGYGDGDNNDDSNESSSNPNNNNNKWNVLQPFLSDDDFHTVMTRKNKPVALQVLQGHRIYDAMRSGILQGFDSFQIEGCMAQFSSIHAQCERIKVIPIPRQYTFFTRLFVWCFIVVTPFCFIQTFATSSRGWVVIPVTVLLSYVFGIIERTGAVNEEPFENRITDVPLTFYCTEIERDLREMLGEEVELIPEKAKPKNGYLF